MAARIQEDFEAPIRELKARLEELNGFYPDEATRQKRQKILDELQALRTKIYAGLTPWQKTLVARHQERPHTNDYIRTLFTDWLEVHGDRRFGDDHAMVTGFAKFHGETVCIVGHQKGRDTKSRIFRNFGYARPEGYRKALRVMRMAEKFRRPIFTFVDTPGAYPGLGAEERGQAEAIAYNLREMARLTVPVVVSVIGEGGSGGALGIAVGDVILMQEYAIYSVISPEGCASILWRSPDEKRKAAEALRLTADDLLGFGLVDRIVPEAVGGAHAGPRETAEILDRHLVEALGEVRDLSPEERLERRYAKFRRMGRHLEGSPD
jgi:acetyl-CoA carboxylase carboxyl transferase subunit alpha